MTFVSHIVPLKWASVNGVDARKCLASSSFRQIRLSRAIVPVVGTRTPLAWFAAATLATLALTHAGYDTSEGSDHARVALHWLQTGHPGMPTPPAVIFLQGPDGLHYPVHELGNILWLMPASAAGLALESITGRTTVAGGLRLAEVLASGMSIVFIALTAAGFWKLLEWGFSASARDRLVTATLLVFATILLPYSRALSDVVATGGWLIWGAAFAARASARGDRASAALSGLCLGCAFLTRVPSAVAIAPIFLAMLARTDRSRRWTLGAIAIAAALPAAAAGMWFNALRTGSPFVPAFLLPRYSFVQPGGGSLLVGVGGLLVSPGKSLLLFSPAILVGLAGLPRMMRERRADAWMVIGTLVLFLLVHGSLDDWHADWGWGPRYFVFIIPLLWLPSLWVFDALRPRTWMRRAVIALVAASVAVQLTALAINWQYQYQLMWHEGRMSEAMYWRADNQLTDAFRAAGANAARTAGGGPPAPVVPGTSAQTVVASTGINVWWISALRLGMPASMIVPVVLALAMFAVFAWRRTIASVRDEDAGRGLDFGLTR